MKFFIFLLFILFIPSCFIVKYPKQELSQPINVKLSPLPKIEMSEELVRSEFGDMIAYLPKDWFFVDAEDESSADVYAVACNPDYTLAAVFSMLKVNSELKKIMDKKDYVGLAKYGFDLQHNKTGGKTSFIGNVNILEIGNLKFTTYKVTTSAGALVANNCIYYSTFGNVYRFALIPMDILGKAQVSQKEADIIFESILCTLKY